MIFEYDYVSDTLMIKSRINECFSDQSPSLNQSPLNRIHLTKKNHLTALVTKGKNQKKVAKHQIFALAEKQFLEKEKHGRFACCCVQKDNLSFRKQAVKENLKLLPISTEIYKQLNNKCGLKTFLVVFTQSPYFKKFLKNHKLPKAMSISTSTFKRFLLGSSTFKVSIFYLVNAINCSINNNIGT